MTRQTLSRRAPDSREFGASHGRWNRADHIRHRDYSPTLGRFIERDPIGFEAGDNNWYRFVANGPMGKSDTSGLCEPGFWSTYFHYLTHPWAMDNDLEYGFYAGAGVAVLAGGAAVAGVATGVGTVGSVGAGVGQLTVAAGTIAAHPSTPSVIGGIAEAAAGIDTPGGLDDLARFGAKTACSRAARAAATAENGFFHGTRYSQKVLEQIRRRPGEFHSFPESVTAFESAGTIRSIPGGDGVVRQMLEIPGFYGGRNGVFQFIKEANGMINHRIFVPRP